MGRKIDVVMVTLNSNKPYFRRCLKSIKVNVPIHHLILVDQFSEDGTINTVKHCFPRAMVIQTTETLASARRLGIDAVDTEYFALIDDDVELRDGWFDKIIRHFSDDKVGAVQGFARYPVDFMDKLILYQLKRAKPVQGVRFRGKAGSAVFSTKAVEDWRPRRDAVAWDALLTLHVISKGYRWLLVRDAQITQFMNTASFQYGILEVLRYQYKRSVWAAAWERLLGALNLKRVFENSVFYLLEGTKVSFEVRNPMVLSYYVCRSLGELYGVLHAHSPYFKTESWRS